MRKKLRKHQEQLAKRQERKRRDATADRGEDVPPPLSDRKRKRLVVEGPLKGYVICQTGLEFPSNINRKDFEKDIVAHGGSIETNPKRCSHLLLLAGGEDSKRHQQAVEYGLTILSLQQLLAIMRGRTVKEFEEEAPTKRQRVEPSGAPAVPIAPDPFAFQPPAHPIVSEPKELAFRI